MCRPFKKNDVDDLKKKKTSFNSKDTDLFMCDICDYKANCKVSLGNHECKVHKKPVTQERFKYKSCEEHRHTKNCQTNNM